MTRHLVRDVDVVEVWFGDIFIATIAPAPPGAVGVSIFSKYLNPLQAFADLGKTPPAMFVPFDLDRPETPNDQQT